MRDAKKDFLRYPSIPMSNESIDVLMVCTGNICRSPTAEVVLRRKAQERGVGRRLEVDSAGTQAYHAGEGADPRTVECGTRRGYDFSSHRARRVTRADFEAYDWILAMDHSHLEALERLSYPGQRARLAMFLEPVEKIHGLEVPDPYYGGPMGFERVLDMCEDACKGWLDRWFPPSQGKGS